MATRSKIIVHHTDGYWHSIHCHFDGYPKHNGRMLMEHYGSQEKAEALLKLGNLSVLAESIDCPYGHTFDTPVKKHCIAYHRDRGDDDQQSTFAHSLKVIWPGQNSDIEYIYTYENGVWHVGKPGPRGYSCREPLSEILQPSANA